MLYYRYTCVAVDWFAHGCKIESNCTIIIHSYEAEPLFRTIAQ
jgi:hypothetical protein